MLGFAAPIYFTKAIYIYFNYVNSVYNFTTVSDITMGSGRGVVASVVGPVPRAVWVLVVQRKNILLPTVFPAVVQGPVVWLLFATSICYEHLYG